MSSFQKRLIFGKINNHTFAIIAIMKNWKPVFIENSNLPIILSKVAPIEIWAIAFGWFVWCRGELDLQTKNHETIHFQQQLELLFVGQWFLYITMWFALLIKHRSAEIAYYLLPFELEAYENESNLEYCNTRKRFSWMKYLKKNRSSQNA